MTSSLATIRFLLLATVAAFFSSAVVPTRCLQFNFPLFTDQNQWELILHNNARIFFDAIQVTPDVRGAPITNESGRAVYKDPFLIRNRDKVASFNTTFELNISPQTLPVGGEGLAFILAADHSAPADSYGQWLGIVNAATNGTPEARIIAVEFDTRKNYPDDIDSNHVGLDLNSVFSIEQKPMSEFGVNLSSGLSVFGMIQYDTENISVFVSMSNKTEDLLKNRVIFRPLNLSILPDLVYVGFSASTSNFTELNCVKSWQFNGTDIGKLVEVVDESIEGQFVKEEIEYLLKLGLGCCHPNPLQRPSMRSVLQVLKGEANPPILPNERPSFVWPPMPPSFKVESDSSLKDSQLVPFSELSGR
ncbi:unnamed protein product [Citrullus colocynthis]|uniref:Legume lectin domain-containing protein n=1 Tax=Citrullus colocynthis TaxID=252529 RepID=A0ABP0YQW9_9ROSI